MGTMFLGVEIGLFISVCFSTLVMIYMATWAHTAVLGRIPGTTVYRNCSQYPEAERYDGILMVRVDAPIFFANAQSVVDQVIKHELRADAELAEKGGGNLKFVILEIMPVSHVDSSGMHMLHDMNQILLDRDIQLCLSNPSVPVMERFVKSGFADEVGRDHIFITIHDAVQWCLRNLDTEGGQENGFIGQDDNEEDGDDDDHVII